MNDENTGVKRDYPTDRSTAGRPNGQDDSPENSSTHEKPPRSNATERTRGCTGGSPRPVGSSDRDAVNTAVHPGDEGVEIVTETTDDDVRKQPTVAERLLIANAFDDAEQREPTPQTLNAEPIRGSYWIQIDNGEAWLASNHVVELEGMR